MNQPHRVLLIGTDTYPRKIEAIKEVRHVADCGLKQAKETVDAVLNGASRPVPLVRDADADAVAQRFAALGFVAVVDGRHVLPEDRRPYRPAWADRQHGTVEVLSLRHLPASDRLRVETQLIVGSADVGDHLGLPLNGSTIVFVLITHIEQLRDGLSIEAPADGDDFELWSRMNVIGEHLPILGPEDG